MTKKNEEIGDKLTTVVKKRGRKPKNLLQDNILQDNILQDNLLQDNIIVIIEENDNDNKCIDDIISDEILNNDVFLSSDTLVEEQKPLAKKRGRKPKGGKIIQQIVPLNNNKESKPNVILHLKCSLKDLQTNTLFGSNIECFNFASNKNNVSYEIVGENETKIQNKLNLNANNDTDNQNKYFDDDIEYDDNVSNKNKESDTKEVWKKLKNLQHNLHVNNISDKKSACFWCTYEFDNPPIYIPKHYIKNSYHVYGCYCSPECATAYLMEENIDSSSKFERYHLINHIYSKIYDYKKNIKPAPNPYYMLDKYYGNLSIQEYRSLLRNERLFLVVDKPLTRILPELHEDNDDFIINNKIIPSNTYQIKKKNQKKQTKSNILNEKFGLSQ